MLQVATNLYDDLEVQKTFEQFWTNFTANGVYYKLVGFSLHKSNIFKCIYIDEKYYMVTKQISDLTLNKL